MTTKTELTQKKSEMMFRVELPDGRWQYVTGLTRSEVRGHAKRTWKLDRLPVGTKIEPF